MEYQVKSAIFTRRHAADIYQIALITTTPEGSSARALFLRRWITKGKEPGSSVRVTDKYSSTDTLTRQYAETIRERLDSGYQPATARTSKGIDGIFVLEDMLSGAGLDGHQIEWWFQGWDTEVKRGVIQSFFNVGELSDPSIGSDDALVKIKAKLTAGATITKGVGPMPASRGLGRPWAPSAAPVASIITEPVPEKTYEAPSPGFGAWA